jgi:hypothetical protein
MAGKKRKKLPFGRPASIGSLLSPQQQSILQYKPIWECWQDAVGPTVAAHAQPEGIQKNGVLWVAVSSSAWMQELQFVKQTIVDSLNQLANKKLVKDIHLRLGDIHPPAPTLPRRPSVSKPAPLRPALEDSGCKKIKEAAEGVRDPELKEVIKGIADRLVSLSKKDF